LKRPRALAKIHVQCDTRIAISAAGVNGVAALFTSAKPITWFHARWSQLTPKPAEYRMNEGCPPQSGKGVRGNSGALVYRLACWLCKLN
jgi:hypothetical protein